MINQLINDLKRLIHDSAFLELPEQNEKAVFEAKSVNHTFLIDINRRGRRDYLTLQMRHGIMKNKVIVRLDLTGPSHKNPAGNFPLANKKIPCPHMHIAKEGYDDRIAYPLEHDYVKMFLNNQQLLDLSYITNEFLKYVNIANIDKINIWEQKVLNV